MIKVQYKHPPRSWKFYAGYLLWLVIIFSPMLLLFIIWSNSVPFDTNLIIASTLMLLGFIANWRTVLEQYILYYDRLIDKGKDVSYQMTVPEGAIEEAINEAEQLGFSRLGEESVFAGLLPKEGIVWHLTSSSEDVHLELTADTGIKPYFAAFSTWFKGQRCIQTYFPVSDTIRYDDFRINAINDSLEAAFHYHLRQVAEFERKYGAPVKLTSMEMVKKAGFLHRKKFLTRMMNKLNIRFIAIRLSSFAMISSFLYWCIASIVAVIALKNSGQSLAYANMDRSLTMIIAGVALMIRGIATIKPNNIAKSKKKSI